MRVRLPVLASLLALVVGVVSPAHAAPAPRSSQGRAVAPRIVPSDGAHLLFSHGSGLAKSPGDSFAIYGGPGTDEGRFQSGRLPDEQGWTGYDDTESANYWHVSTFTAQNLDPATVPNHALWCGAENQPGWANPTGYGNSWNTSVEYRYAVADPSQSHTVRLEFVFNHDIEPGYDYFKVLRDSAGVQEVLDRYDGYNATNWGDPPVTPVVYDRTISYSPAALTGPGNDEIRFILNVSSDGAWSAQDGLWPSVLGAAQVDKIRVSVDGVEVSYADFEGSPGDADWQQIKEPFAGDFFKVLPFIVDLDPCINNTTPVAGFIDDGTPPNNAPGESTGGSYSPNWSPLYGGSAVVNFTGGLSDGLSPVDNAMVSPVIAWDDPTTTADEGLDSGAFIRFDVYGHMPILNGMFWFWSIRSADTSGEWSNWEDRGFVYEGGSVPNWSTRQIEVRDLLVDAPETVQLRLGVRDLSMVFGFPGNDATISPIFDNVSVWRYQHLGPTIIARQTDLFRDTFPAGSTLDPVGDPAGLACRIDTSGQFFDSAEPTDSLVCDVVAIVPGTDLDGPPEVWWALEANPFFDGVRQIPAGATQVGTNAQGWPIWRGVVPGQNSTNAGNPLPDRFYFDLPDGPARPGVPGDVAEPALFFPGDVLRYAVIARDTGGGFSHLPVSIDGLETGAGYDPRFEIRALPALDDGGIQNATILVWNDAGQQTDPAPVAQNHPWNEGDVHELQLALQELGLRQGEHFDLFRTHPWRDDFDGLGADQRSGATVAQIGNYSTILYAGGDERSLLGDGEDPYQWSPEGAASDDITLVRAWRDLPGSRNAAWFADAIATFAFVIAPTNLKTSFVQGDLQLDFLESDVRPYIDEQIHPVVAPDSAFPPGAGTPLESFLAYGGCPSLNTFDAVAARGPAVVTHRFLGRDETPASSVVAGVLHERNVGGALKRDWSFPFDFSAVTDARHEKATGGASARALLLKSILDRFGEAALIPVTVQVPDRFEVQEAAPNPFNPRTEIAFTAPSAGTVRATIFDLRGRRVRTLHDGPVPAGSKTLVWDGTDAAGASVASGVYLYSVEGFGKAVRGKVALVK